MSEATIFQQIDSLAAQGQPMAILHHLQNYLKQEHRYHELFEVLKMQLRLELGLPPTQADADERLEEERELQLERGLLDACRVVGELFLQDGKIREGWMYLRPVGDRAAAAKALAAVEPTDENLDELLEVLLHEAVDVRRGYQLALERLGTCNSITLFESTLAMRPRHDQQIAAELLVRHVHGELLENVRRDIEQRESTPPQEATLEEILAARPELLRDGTYHLDTSHLASTVRFARVLDNPEALRLARDVAAYGKQLHPQYHYPGEEPFLDLYPASLAFFDALLGQRVEAGIRYFKHKADTVDRQRFGLVAVEVLIDLLARVGRHEEALEEYRKRIPPGARLMGIAPTLLQLSQRLGDYTKMREICSERDDVLGYAAALLHAPSAPTAAAATNHRTTT
ncbi:MAG: hypothetical protein KatS3mg111_2672 [Pirellulaceae bacterium]|nr:MAG: hypothetical protein KatS3mg111_2672 [Pirellulaceae bacterium]